VTFIYSRYRLYLRFMNGPLVPTVAKSCHGRQRVKKEGLAAPTSKKASSLTPRGGGILKKRRGGPGYGHWL